MKQVLFWNVVQESRQEDKFHVFENLKTTGPLRSSNVSIPLQDNTMAQPKRPQLYKTFPDKQRRCKLDFSSPAQEATVEGPGECAKPTTGCVLYVVLTHKNGVVAVIKPNVYFLNHNMFRPRQAIIRRILRNTQMVMAYIYTTVVI